MPQARRELRLDRHVPRRAVAQVGDGHLEFDRLALEHLPGRRVGDHVDLELGLEHPRSRPAAGLEPHRRDVVERARLGRLHPDADTFDRNRREAWGS